MEKNKNSLDISLNGIKFPLLSEKAILLSKENKYTFIVAKTLTKLEIKKSLEFLLNINIINIKTSILPQKTKKVGKHRGKITTYKKAVIQLKENSPIFELFN